MAPKRPLDSDSAEAPAAKKHRKGFRVGPQNLPDGPWKRKVDKIKKNLIHKAKVKKAYKKIKAAELASSSSSKPELAAAAEGAEEAPSSAQIHPERQAMLGEDDQPDPSSLPPDDVRSPRKRRGKARKPGYFDKALLKAEVKKAEAEARAQEAEKRKEERNRKSAERERFRKAMAKARAPGRDGQRRLGRESGLLLEKVKKLVGEGN
ncbi:hypothetical protein GGS23DRAFT_407645 [Durotheca rogersii]|uniref:uncharacterized protein n=1 Tax=Durotheca rogersii TaxID=419775 RepID=UPI002220DB0F|nr:uncharacterized protein GGS23DRAFT_407645 [Durotheca rogersii]KAI5865078.1 hypothetical protein GGS23DRAFT_407645 [Durotheca rogersii]